jgi:hypothetical protein
MVLSRYAALLVLLVAVPGVREAEAQRPSAQALAAAKKIECTYTLMSTGTWTNGEPKFTPGPATLKIAYFNVDTQESTAEIESAAGNPYYIVVRYVGNYLHLMQINSEGPVYTTTVYARESKPGSGRYVSMHSRHEYLDFALPGVTSRPEQYLGDCAISS